MVQSIVCDIGSALHGLAVIASVIVAILAVAFIGGMWWLLDLLGAFSVGGG